MTARDEWLTVDAIDLEAQGVARNAEGKVVFIEGALLGEQAQVTVLRRKNQWERASIATLRRHSAQRVQPRCPHFGVCGGCNMQHLHVGAQIAVKQRALEDSLWHVGKVRAEQVLRPIAGPSWRYRHRARLSVRHVAKHGGVLIGFHERQSSHVADIRRCEILPAHVSAMLLPLRALIARMEAPDRLPQIELAIGDGPQGFVTALVLRHLEPLNADDRARLREFGALHGVQWWLQAKGPDSAVRLDDGGPLLAYRLPAFGIVMPFRPTDFTQVNHAINEAMVSQALRLLAVRDDERVIDWFCGLGNFSLPLATQAREVLGIEGSEALVRRAQDNAALNGFTAVRFESRNLFELSVADLHGHGEAQKWLVDPPREGAFALVKALSDALQLPVGTTGWQPPQRIVYVSCNPATLARDAGLLVHRAGYRCTLAGAINMFPHTGHVESMAVFERAAVDRAAA